MAFAACSFQISAISGWTVGAGEMAPASWAEEVNDPKTTVARLRSRTAMICRLRRRSIVTFVDFIVFSLRNPGYSSLCGPCDFASGSLSEAHGTQSDAYSRAICFIDRNKIVSARLAAVLAGPNLSAHQT